MTTINSETQSQAIARYTAKGYSVWYTAENGSVIMRHSRKNGVVGDCIRIGVSGVVQRKW